MATVTSQYFAGKTVNVPHTEFSDKKEVRGVPEKGTVTFDDNGKAQVSPTLADALKEFYPKVIA